MKKWITYLCCLMAVGTCSFASDTTKVLFIGNSFTAVEDVPGLVKKLAEQAGMPMQVWMHAPGGVSVGDVSQGQMAHMNNPQVFDLIRENELDFVVLQDNQGRFVNTNGFPNPAQSRVVDGHMKIRDSMRHHHSCARMIFFAGWALKNCWPDIGNGDQCMKNIYKNYCLLNNTAEEIISPIGIAWMRAKQQLPAIDLWSPDEAHQSAAGGYLTAAVIFTSIYRMNTENVAFAAQLDTAAARTLRRIAYQSVMDSVSATGLAGYMPALTRNGNTLTASGGFSQYNWYRDGVLAGTTVANTFTATTAGCYQVIVTNSKGCRQRSPQQCVQQGTGIEQLSATGISITPNPAQHEVLLQAGHQGRLKRYRVIAMTGQELRSGSFSEASVRIPVSDLPDGLYLCSVMMGDRIMHTRLLKATK